MPAFGLLDLPVLLHLFWALTGPGSNVYLRGASLVLGSLVVLLLSSSFLQWHLLGKRSMAGSSGSILPTLLLVCLVFRGWARSFSSRGLKITYIYKNKH